MNYSEAIKKNLPFFLAVFWFFVVVFLNNLSFLGKGFIKINLALIFFVLIGGYLSNWQLFILGFLGGIFFDWLYISWPVFLVKFIVFSLAVIILREKIMVKNNLISLVVFLVLGNFIFEFSKDFQFIKSIFFAEELIFSTVLLIITFLLKERVF